MLFLRRIARNKKALPPRSFLRQLPFLSGFDRSFRTPVTFFVGENGAGKSTLMEALAELAGLPVRGGSKNEGADAYGPEQHAELAPYLSATWNHRPRWGWFFRAELAADFASLLDRRFVDPDFRLFGDNPYDNFGGRSLHTRSHGETFLQIFGGMLSDGFFLLDEPESALSPQNQLRLLASIDDVVKRGGQLVIATHSPMLMTYPEAEIWEFTAKGVDVVPLQATSHYSIMRGILESPERYWRHLRAEDSESRDRQSAASTTVPRRRERE